MKLVKQSRLSFQAGSSDKVYEVDLCEVGGVGKKYVVNFRYGRRGSTLREGTKTERARQRLGHFDRRVEVPRLLA